VEKAIKEIRDTTAAGNDDVLGMYLNCWQKMV